MHMIVENPLEVLYTRVLKHIDGFYLIYLIIHN